MKKLEYIRGTVRPFNNGEQVAQLGTCVNKVIDYINELEKQVERLEARVKELEKAR